MPHKRRDNTRQYINDLHTHCRKKSKMEQRESLFKVYLHTLDTVAVIGAVVGDPEAMVVDTISLGDADRNVQDMDVLAVICVHDIEHIDSV